LYGEDLLLPQGGVLLHVGPHKTGTTAIQGAMKLARPQMAEHGVVYAGNVRQHEKAALAMTGSDGLIGDRAATPADWDTLVADVAAAASERVVVSSEYFDDANDETAQRIVEGLGGDRVHVVVTLRPLAKILPSAWQQYVRNGLRRPYGTWLDRILNDRPQKPTPSFWRRQHHDVLIERWASIVGPQRLLVIVVDESEPDELLRTFERITGLPNGLLELERRTNRSLTAAETELIRVMNLKYRVSAWPPRVYHRMLRWGVVEQMQQREPGPHEARIATPDWAIERANDIAAAAAERIAASGVHVIGDLSALSSTQPRGIDMVSAPKELPIRAAAEAIAGTLMTSGALNPPKPPPTPPRLVSDYTTRELLGIVRRRARARVADNIGARRGG
jgi:hypothetical protein